MVPKGLAELLIVLRDQLRELSVNLQPARQSQASVNHALSLSRTRNFETGKNTKFVFESYLKKKKYSKQRQREVLFKSFHLSGHTKK